MHRLFVAARPPRAIRAQLLALMDGVDGARWQDDEQLHLTLRFIGEVDARVADDVVTAVSRISSAPFWVALKGVGSFGKRFTIDTLWAGLSPHAPLVALHARIDRALVMAGLEPDRRAFLPHITLARLNRSAGPAAPFLTAQAGLTSAPFMIDHITLFESTLGRSGATYDAVARWPLG